MDQIHRKYELPHTSRRREEIEWSIHYAFNAGDRTLPRVLLVGDSICNGYHAQVRERLLGIANVLVTRDLYDHAFERDLLGKLQMRDRSGLPPRTGIHS